MLDGTMPEETKVWGFTVPVSSTGRRKWPEALRAQVVEKINNGAGIRETAEEIGANKSLVALWVKKAEPSASCPAFVELVAPENLRPETASVPIPPAGAEDSRCQISVGDMTIAIPPGYPVTHLAEVLQAVRGAQ
ncbi:transposase [Antarcticimicrobium luteum]|uniref:Transposase n=1 Tax=Antarcticimicrobium luteum TaxID=2547397 RepID=A0A4R5VF30_9RHOB|nr:transposase [Antarcticimicrobium luteum]TDK50349.1 transposase [Antarcticimicrobium luteum]